MRRRATRLPPPSAWPVSAWLLVAVNLVPLAGALWLGWQVLDLLLLFWVENLVVGVLNLLRMAAAPRREALPARLFLMAFFCLHYGGFAAAHGVAVLSLFAAPGPGLADGAALWAAVRSPAIAWAAAALLVSHAVSLVSNDWIGGERRQQVARALMMRPYRRVVVMHITILVGGLAISLLGSPIWALAVLVLVKLGMDLTLHLREHSRGLIMNTAGSVKQPGSN